MEGETAASVIAPLRVEATGGQRRVDNLRMHTDAITEWRAWFETSMQPEEPGGAPSSTTTLTETRWILIRMEEYNTSQKRSFLFIVGTVINMDLYLTMLRGMDPKVRHTHARMVRNVERGTMIISTALIFTGAVGGAIAILTGFAAPTAPLIAAAVGLTGR